MDRANEYQLQLDLSQCPFPNGASMAGWKHRLEGYECDHHELTPLDTVMWRAGYRACEAALRAGGLDDRIPVMLNRFGHALQPGERYQALDALGEPIVRVFDPLETARSAVRHMPAVTKKTAGSLL